MAKLCRCTKSGCNLPAECFQIVFNEYYAMSSPQQYRFLADHIDITEPARRYYIKIRGVRHQLCERMFLASLSLKDSSLRKTKLKLQQGITCFDDGRGRTRGVNKFQITEETKNRIRHHILSYKARESHYARKKQGLSVGI
ncbi:unnamed protein product [Allacma fusca]|uniref:Uncharacterized protein n=1 Tax=Allacma fusca TaxID=39272 RepID=A0A8J2L811_9HEXA|nr:unnamed protein product [Allacma fusca]